MKMHDKQSGVIIISTFPVEESSISTAKELLNKRLCACVNLVKSGHYITGITSEDQEEYLVLFKCATSTLKELKSELKGAHPYDVPEIVEIRMNDVSESIFHGWQNQQLGWKRK